MESNTESKQVTTLLSADQVLERTLEYARHLIATVSPNSLRQTRWQIYRDLQQTVDVSVTASEDLLNQMMKEPDYAEGVKAFLEKRPPAWGGGE